MSNGPYDPSHGAMLKELERLKRFGARLAALQPREGVALQEIEAMQDANLAAFESMTEEVGLAALGRMTLLVEELQAEMSAADAPDAAAQIGPRMKAAAQDLDALRDQETERLLHRIETLFAVQTATREDETDG